MKEQVTQFLEASLMWVLILGVTINSLMLFISIRRRWRFPTAGSILDQPHEGGWLKRQIGRLTLNRAIRLEAGLLACQLIRLAHTLYARRTGDSDLLALWGVVARESMTLVLVWISLADLITRNRLVRLQRRLTALAPSTERLH